MWLVSGGNERKQPGMPMSVSHRQTPRRNGKADKAMPCRLRKLENQKLRGLPETRTPVTERLLTWLVQQTPVSNEEKAIHVGTTWTESSTERANNNSDRTRGQYATLSSSFASFVAVFTSSVTSNFFLGVRLVIQYIPPSSLGCIERKSLADTVDN